MQFISGFLIFTGVWISTLCYSQNVPIKQASASDYAAPVDIPMLLSGNYGEIRTAHFHSGIDIKTEQVEGKHVLAANAGYVFRIAVHSGGYGKALYLKHPNGQVTVYGHLQQFSPAVDSYVREQQYARKSFEIELYPKANQFSFNRGDVIGLSGNSGNSFGPHLHFEIRDELSVPLNALQYGFSIADKTRPRINWLAVYPLDHQSTVSGASQKLLVPVTCSDATCYIADDCIEAGGNIGLGIETFDFLDYSANECGPYTLAMTFDERQVYMCRIDSIPFSLTSSADSHIDYEEKLKSGRIIQKLYVDPNNPLRIYKVLVNNGIIQIRDSLVHHVSIEVKDTYGNESQLRFTIRGKGTLVQKPKVNNDQIVQKGFRYDTLNVFEDQDIRVVIPRDALFRNLDFQYSRIKNDSCIYSMIHQVHNRYTPLFKPYILSIRPEYLPRALQDKALIANFGKKGEWISQGGTYKGGYVTTKVKEFGDFFVAVDTTNPAIAPVGFNTGDSLEGKQNLSFRITDSLSGISEFAGYIDRKWALFEYDAKNDLLTYVLDDNRLDKNRLHILEIVVTDNKNNAARYRGEFFY